MKNFVRFLGPLLAVSAVGLFSREARALGPIDLEVGGKVGYGTNPVSNSSLNPLGVGLGGRAGVTFLGFYGGVNIVDYLGGSQGPASVNALEYGLELGYTIKVLMLRIRPQVGFGNITFNESSQGVALPVPGAPTVGANLSQSQSSFYLEPGVTALFTFGILYFGADANALIITSGPSSDPTKNSQVDTGFTIHGQIGLTF